MLQPPDRKKNAPESAGTRFRGADTDFGISCSHKDTPQAWACQAVCEALAPLEAFDRQLTPFDRWRCALLAAMAHGEAWRVAYLRAHAPEYARRVGGGR